MTTYSTGEFAKIIGVTPKTIQRWDESGKLIAKRTPTNRRYYTEEDVNAYFGHKPNDIERKNVAYCRVSNRTQKDDLVNQIEFIKQFANARGEIVDEYIQDIGSGLNYKRPHWNRLLDQVMNNEINTIYITYKDRFIRFGYDWFESLCSKHKTDIVVLNDPSSSPEEELMHDLISIIHGFSYRIYGLRKYKEQLESDYDAKNL